MHQKILNRLYTSPGMAMSCLLSLSPSFRFSAAILRVLGAKVHESVTVHFLVRFVVCGRMNLKRGVTINSGCFVDNRKGIDIGENSMIGRKCSLYTMGHNNNCGEFSSFGAPISIGKNVVIYPHSIIMPGVHIGDFAVVYPGSIVTKDVRNNSIVAGSPARVVGERQNISCYELSYKCYFGV